MADIPTGFAAGRYRFGPGKKDRCQCWDGTWYRHRLTARQRRL